METVINEIFRALGYLLIAGVISFTWKQASDTTQKEDFKKVLWKGLLWCAGISLLASFTLGNPTCTEQSDPIYGGCEQYADNGFKPTTEQRVASFSYFLTLLYIPVVFGVFSRKKKSTT